MNRYICLCIYLLGIQVVVAQQLEFSLVTLSAPWGPRWGFQIDRLPDSTFVLYGGYNTSSGTIQVNDQWISKDLEVWNQTVGPGQNSSFPASPRCSLCSDLQLGTSFAIPDNHNSQTHSGASPIWLSKNQKNWASVEASTKEGVPIFVDRVNGNCFIDSQSRLYYIFGINASTLNLPGHRQFYTDIWRSDDYRYWVQVARNLGFTPRFRAQVQIQLKNPFLRTDVIYTLGGQTFGSPDLNVADLWASSDQGHSWCIINPLVPGLLGSSPTFRVASNGILSIVTTFKRSNGDVVPQFWVSLDGGFTWGQCLQAAKGYSARLEVGLVIDAQGYPYLLGGFYREIYSDVWKGNVSFLDTEVWSHLCGLPIPPEGVGITTWPYSKS